MKVLNKNVIHNGKAYAKGAEIKEGDEGYKLLVEAGHVSEVEKVVEVKPEAKAEEKSDDKPAKKK